MRKYRTGIIVIIAAVLLALYLLYPTYRDSQLQGQLNQLRGPDSLAFLEQNENEIRDNRAKRIKLGLDLQGGMRVVLEVNVLKLIEDLAKNKDDVFAPDHGRGPRAESKTLRRVSGPPPAPQVRGSGRSA